MTREFRYRTLYFFLYAPLGVVCPLIGTYLDYIGFTGSQIGTITSVGTLVAILAGFFWGKMYANSKNPKRVILILCLMAPVFAIASTFTRVFLIYLLIYSAMYFFQGPMMGLVDSRTIDRTKNFSVIRAYGAAGYAIAVFVAGQLGEAMGLENIFYLYAFGYLTAFLLFITEKDEVEIKQVKKEKVKIGDVLKNRKLLKLLICAVFIQATNVPNATYFTFLFQDGGGSVAGVGLAFLLMAGSEAPFMFLLPYINRKVPTEKVIPLAMAVSVLRFFMYSFGPSSTFLLATFLLQGIVNGLVLVELVRYVSKLAGERLSSMAISTYYAASCSGSTIVTTFISGHILDAFGSTGVYVFFTALNLVGLTLYILMGLHKTS
ncbi:MAG: MFS transporter [Clostridia bacterium]|nr:MFS transporter [Clostridia bacterium]